MEKKEYRGREKALTIGRCIYCGAAGETVKLTDEHVIPYSLGADVYLKAASCLACAEITKKFELHVARSIFGHHRIHKGVQTRHPEQRPTELPARVLVRGVEHRKELAIADHPYFLAMPIWDRPGILRGLQPSDEFDGLSAHLYYHIPENIKDTLQLSDGELAEIRPESRGDARVFGRAIAKIAYCNTIATLGIDAFDALDLPNLILGKYPYVSYLVGSVLRHPPPPAHGDGALHRIDVGYDWVRNPQTGLTRRMIVSDVRLFRADGTKQNGMPVYTVVVGAPK